MNRIEFDYDNAVISNNQAETFAGLVRGLTSEGIARVELAPSSGIQIDDFEVYGEVQEGIRLGSRILGLNNTLIFPAPQFYGVRRSGSLRATGVRIDDSPSLDRMRSQYRGEINHEAAQAARLAATASGIRLPIAHKTIFTEVQPMHEVLEVDRLEE